MKLSIITVTKNNAPGLIKTIESVINQKYTDFEYLIIDGGSLDNTLEIISKFSKHINYWVSEEDRGIYNAMNKGIEKAKGEYCYFLNSGDFFADQDVLSKVFHNQLDEEIVFGNMKVMLNHKLEGIHKGKAKITFIDVYNNIVKHQAAFIRHDLFSKYGTFKETFRIMSDWEFFLKTLGFGNVSYKYLDIDISCFDNNGISNNNPALVSSERKEVIDSLLPAMMHEDFALLQRMLPFKILLANRLSYLILRGLSKFLRAIH